MCGRYRLKDPKQAAMLLVHEAMPELETPRWNVAPTQVVPVVRRGDDRPRLVGMRWGLVPFYERSKPKPLRLINARAETAPSKPAYRRALAQSRCAVLADGFYEWRRIDERTKEPWFFGLKDEKPFAFAGIYEEDDAAGNGGFCILTTQPNAVAAKVHDRMPVILDAPTVERWLAPGPLDPDTFAGLTAPYPADLMVAWPVTTLVNSPRNDQPECSAPGTCGPSPLVP